MWIGKFNDLIEEGRTVSGRWEFGPSGQIVYRALKGRSGTDLRLEAAPVAAEPFGLAIAAGFSQKDGTRIKRIFKLSGFWKVDSCNRLFFTVTRTDGKADALIFGGKWELGPNYEVVYFSEERAGFNERSRVIAQRLIIPGTWDVARKKRLVFYVGSDVAQPLEFKGVFESRRLSAQLGAIRFRLSVGSGFGRWVQTLCFFGSWKLSSNLGLAFEIEYGPEKKQTINFGAQYRMHKDQSISARLKTQYGRPLRAAVIMSRDFLEGAGQGFLKLCPLLEDSRIEAGIRTNGSI